MLGDNSSVVFGLILFAVLLALNALFVAAEFAFITVRRTQMQHLASEGNRAAKRILGTITHLDFYVAASQLGITMATIGIGFLGEPVLAGLIEPPIESLVGGFAPAISHTVAIAVAFGIATTLHIVLGEFAPKSIALQQPGRTAMWVSLPMEIFVRIFRPFIWALNSTGFALLRLFGMEIRPVGDEPLRAEDLAYTLESSASAGLISRRELDLSRNTLQLTTLDVTRLMIPRTDVVGIPVDATREDVVRIFATHRFTRYPVYDGSLDNVVGMLDAKNAVYDLKENGREWQDDIVPPIILPESVSIEQALAVARENKRSMIILADEFGGISGLLSMFDVVEFLAGHLPDEHESTPRGLRHFEDGSMAVPGQMHLSELENHLAIDLPDINAHTLGGLYMELSGQVPSVGDEVTVGSYLVRVTEMDGNRIDEALIIPLDGREEDQNEL